MIALVFVVALFALPATAQPWIRVQTRNGLGKVVPGPPTTSKRLNVMALFPGLYPDGRLLCSDGKWTVTRNANEFDIAFTVIDECGWFGDAPAFGEVGFIGYLPAGTYTARRIIVHQSGAREVDDTLTFEVLEAGPPLDIPALSSITLAALAILIGVIAIKHIR